MYLKNSTQVEDVALSGFVRSVGEFFGLPNPVHIVIYLLVMVVIVCVILCLICWGTKVLVVILVCLLVLCILAVIIIVWFWIGIDPDDIPEMPNIDTLYNSTLDTLGINKTSSYAFELPCAECDDLVHSEEIPCIKEVDIPPPVVHARDGISISNNNHINIPNGLSNKYNILSVSNLTNSFIHNYNNLTMLI